MKMLYSDKRIWIEDEEGKTVGEIDFLQDQNGKYDIVHTGVDPSQQLTTRSIISPSGWGTAMESIVHWVYPGTAGMLVQAAADYIRSTGRKTGASCSYASAWLKRHKEYGDIYEP